MCGLEIEVEGMREESLISLKRIGCILYIPLDTNSVYSDDSKLLTIWKEFHCRNYCIPGFSLLSITKGTVPELPMLLLQCMSL